MFGSPAASANQILMLDTERAPFLHENAALEITAAIRDYQSRHGVANIPPVVITNMQLIAERIIEWRAIITLVLNSINTAHRHARSLSGRPVLDQETLDPFFSELRGQTVTLLTLRPDMEDHIEQADQALNDLINTADYVPDMRRARIGPHYQDATNHRVDLMAPVGNGGFFSLSNGNGHDRTVFRNWSELTSPKLLDSALDDSIRILMAAVDAHFAPISSPVVGMSMTFSTPLLQDIQE